MTEILFRVLLLSQHAMSKALEGAWGIVVLGNGNGCGGMPTTKQSVKDSLLQLRVVHQEDREEILQE